MQSLVTSEACPDLDAVEARRGDVGKGRAECGGADGLHAGHVAIVEEVVRVYGNRHRYRPVAGPPQTCIGAVARLTGAERRNRQTLALGVRVGVAARGTDVGVLQGEVQIAAEKPTPQVLEAT